MNARIFILFVVSLSIGFAWELSDLSLEKQQPAAGILVLVAAAMWLRRSLMSPDERESLHDPARLLAAALAIRLFLTAHPPGWDADWFRQTLATAWLWIGLCLW